MDRRQPLGHSLLNGLVAYWPLDDSREPSANSGWRDLHSGMKLSQGSGGPPSNAQGVYGAQASLFETVNSEYLLRASEAALQVADIDFTFSAWVYPVSLPAAAARVVSKRANGTTSHEYDLYVETGGKVGFFLRTAAGTQFGLEGASTTVTTSAWHLIWGWHDASADTVNVQVNSGAVDSITSSGNVPTTNTSEFQIGSLQQVARPWDGRIMGVSFWKRVLTAEERTYLYNGGIGRKYPFV